MKLDLVRRWFTEQSTIGELSVDGVFLCYTLEDVVRPAGVKIWGETAIPAGTYPVILNYSNRFQRIMPLIANVPGFEGIRIHAGNTAADTEGCILVGLARGQEQVQQSRLAFEKLFPRLQAGEREGITITLTNDPSPMC